MKPVFLSSCFSDPPGHRLGFRDRVLETTGGTGADAARARPIWLAEDYPELLPSSPWSDIRKADFCLDGVRAAECFVAVITKRHGSAVTVDGAGAVPTSFFEAELFEAARLEKPSFVFLLEGYEPEGKLESLLRLLGPSFPNMDLTPKSEDDILRRIDALIRHFGRPRWIRSPFRLPRIRPIARALFRARHHPYDVRNDLPPVRFLGVMRDPALGTPDPALVEKVLETASAAPQNQTRMMLVWFAIRALMGAPYSDPAFSRLLPLWSRAFGAWVSAGAWYGMHGHTAMGCLAALGSASEIQVLQRPGDEKWRTIPHGALASEYYSQARLAGGLHDLLQLSLSHIEIAIEGAEGNPSNALAIRGSVHRELGDMASALADYETVVRFRHDGGGAAYGEALSEYGFALTLSGQRQRGIELMESGLEILKDEPLSGFRIRAMRKLALGYARGGSVLRALDQAVAAFDAATELGAYDQIRGLERLAKQVDRMRFWSRHG